MCDIRKVVLQPDLMHIARGGESMDAVRHRKEELEMPRYEPGAFQVEDPSVTMARPIRVSSEEKARVRNYNKFFMESVQVIPPGSRDCDITITEPTLFITRYEYANLFHTSTDWCVHKTHTHTPEYIMPRGYAHHQRAGW